MEKEKKPKHFIQQPEFPGGPKELAKFLYAHLRYPPAALEAKVEGTVLVEYDIDYKGNVVDTRVLQGIGYGCDEEASRVVRLLKFDVGRNRGVRVLFHKKAHIRFKLPVPAKTPAQPQPVQASGIQYNYVYTTDTPAPEEAPKSPVFTYTITMGA